MVMAVQETLSGSEHYIWYLHDIIGKGATGNVFKCRNKHNGEVFAVKTFDSAACSRVPGLQAREIEVVRQLRHPNIVEVVSVETEVDTNSHVIIMELCAGSVYHMLEEPDNSYGVTEEVFVQIMKDVANGMKYLNEMRVVHRDIKPGNILKVVKDDGDVVFKLSDFGASRQMKEDEERFYSLHGTEEYLDPAIYQRAVLRNGISKGFNASIDLWSLGVTLYQVITGTLPFRPLNGRNGSKETMFKLTAEKGSGVIAGQEVEKGRITWSRELPDTCQLSVGFKGLVTPVIAGLLENEAQQKWDFDTFYKKAESLWTMTRIYVFHMFECSSISVYADKQLSIAKLNELIAQQTGVPADAQLLLFNSRPLTTFVSGICPTDKFPKTTSERPYVLFYNTDFGDPMKLKPLIIPPFPVFGTTFSLEKDATLSKKCAAILCLISRNVHYYMRQQILLTEAVAMVSLFIRDLVEDMSKTMDMVQHQIEELEREFGHFKEQRKNTLSIFKLMGKGRSHSNDVIQQEMSELQKHHFSSYIMETTETMQRLRRNVDDFYKRVIEHKELEGMWKHGVGCSDPEKCMKMIGSFVKTAHETSQIFREHKIRGKLSYNEEQIHKVDKNKLNTTSSTEYMVSNCRNKLNTTSSKAVSLCNDACFKCLYRLHKELTQTHLGSKLHGWFSFAVQIKLRTERLTLKIQSLSSTGQDMSAELDSAYNTMTHSYNTVMKAAVRLEQDPPESGYATGGEVEPDKSTKCHASTTGDTGQLTSDAKEKLLRSITDLHKSHVLLRNNVKATEDMFREVDMFKSLPVSTAHKHKYGRPPLRRQEVMSSGQTGIAVKLNDLVN